MPVKIARSVEDAAVNNERVAGLRRDAGRKAKAAQAEVQQAQQSYRNQREGFINAAAELGCDENERAFEEAVRAVPRASSDEHNPPLTQRQRFIEVARELGCEENLAQFDEAVKRMAR